MHPILFQIPQIVIKVAALGLMAGGVLGVVLALLPAAVRAKIRFAPATPIWSAIGIAAGVAIVRFASGKLEFWLPATYAARWSALPIYSYGVMLGTSLVVGWYITLGLGARDGLPKDAMANCYVYTAISAVVGARLAFILVNPEQFPTFLDMLKINQGGIVAYGGFLGGLLASWWYMSRQKISLLAWADVASPSLGTGLAITRIGCYLYGCDFGRRLSEHAPSWLRKIGTFPHWTHPAWGDGSPAFRWHLTHGWIEPTATHALAVHPTELYESVAGLALFGMMMAVRRYRKFRGQVFLSFAMAYAMVRFAIEGLRDDPARGQVLGLSTSQFIGAVILPVAAIAYFKLWQRARRDPAAAMSLGPALDAPAKGKHANAKGR